MMIISGFVVSPLSDVERTSWRRTVVDSRAAGKLFQMTGPATAKLFVPGVVLVLGTDSDPVPADCLLYMNVDAYPRKESALENDLLPDWWFMYWCHSLYCYNCCFNAGNTAVTDKRLFFGFRR